MNRIRTLPRDNLLALTVLDVNGDVVNEVPVVALGVIHDLLVQRTRLLRAKKKNIRQYACYGTQIGRPAYTHLFHDAHETMSALSIPVIPKSRIARTL